jgi:Tfp pilus tip-associated adhesin PilY1
MKRVLVTVGTAWAILLAPGLGGAEETPFFVGEIFYPNALIIFDNSDSMQDVPYTNPGGIAVRSSGQKWELDVTDAAGAPLRDTASGNLLWATRTDRNFAVQGSNAYRKADGGNHPASKLYQAKQALQAILNPPSGSFENVNLGFATYLSMRTPRVGAKYWALQPGTTIPGTTTTINRPTRWQFLGWQNANDAQNVRQPFADRFSAFGTTVNPAAVGGQFTRYWTDTDPQTTAGCASLRDQHLIYTITSVAAEYNPVDGQFLGYRWNFNAPYINYSYRVINDANYDATCTAASVWNACDPSALPLSAGGWSRVTAPTSCRLWQKIPAETTVVVYTGSTRPDMYLFQWAETQGSWVGPTTGGARWIDRTTLEVTPLASYTSGGYTYQLMVSDVSGVINTAGATATVSPGRYRADTFAYPGYGTPDRPHAWSYVKRQATTSDLVGTWSQAITFPSDVPDPEDYGNIRGDNHILFVDLPAADNNDAAMLNKAKILEFVSTERYQSHPRYGAQLNVYNQADATINYDYTTMPHTLNLASPRPSIPPNTTTAVATRATPLAASLRYAKAYYESYIAEDNPTQDDCRQNYVILLTDGLDTADCNPTDDAATYAACLNGAGSPVIQAAQELAAVQYSGTNRPVKTYVVGFGLETAQQAALNDLAAAGGTTQAYFASNVNELVTALTTIFQAIQSGRYTRSDLSVTRSGDRIYVAYFNYPGWAGRLKSFDLNVNTGAIVGETAAWGGDPGACPGFITSVTGDTCTGDAGGSVHDTALQTTRKVYTTAATGLNPTRTSFTFTQSTNAIVFDEGSLAGLKALVNPSGADIDGDGTADEDEDAEKILKFMLNPSYNDTGTVGLTPYKGTRYADWRLPDFYHTMPVPVGPPTFNVSWGGYPQFKTARANRDTVVYIGGNGGMLHAINARYIGECDASHVGNETCDDDGTERWGFVPRMVLGNLKNLRVEHSFFVDSKPVVADIYSDGGSGTVFAAPATGHPEEGWHTVLVSGMRDGGRGYFALDVTDPDNPVVLWELTDANMAYTWSSPTIGRVRVGTADKWVAFVGGGWSNPSDPSENDKGNRLYIIDIETGALLQQAGNTGEYVIGSAANKVPSAIRDVDLDRNGYVERIYFGDLEGKLWKMDLTSTSMSDWQPCVLLDPVTYNFGLLANPPAVDPNTAGPRPIYYQPAVALGDSGNYLVFFGTGDEQAAQDKTHQDFFYEVEDNGTLAGGSPPPCTGTVNWVKAFPRTGEKMLARPVVFNRVVYFTTYVPPAGGSLCNPGAGYLWGLTTSSGSTSTGGGEAGLTLDPGGGSLSTPEESRYLGAGVPTAPVVTNGTIYVTTSNTVGAAGSGGIQAHRINPLGGVIRGWREVF